MPLATDALQFVDGELAAIDVRLKYGDPSVEPKNPSISATLAGPGSIINNTAYHDFQRIELGTPVITQKLTDSTLTMKTEKLLDFTVQHPWLFPDAVNNATPTDASEVEELIAEMKADLAVMAAGPIPPVVQSFAIEGLSDYIEQSTWLAMSPAERDRFAQLASLWAALTGRSPSGTSAAGGSSGGGDSSSGSFFETLKSFADPLGVIF